MDITAPRDASTLSLGLLILRLVFGLLMAAHGSQKLFAWFGGYGIAGTGGFLESLGFRPGTFFATLAGLGELTSGVLIALGALGPIGPALMISVMIVAAVSVHWTHGVFAANNGIEVPLLYSTAALALALTGFGAYSIDAAIGLDRVWTTTLTWTIVAVGIVGGVGNLLLRRAPAPAQG
jgi:putative oxidoreductase